MANVYASLRWIIDTAGVISTDKLRISCMEWVPAATGDDLAIVDNAGEAIWTVTDALTGGRAGVELMDTEINTEGLNVSTIGGGTLYIYLK